jgi:hypothetical protein
MSLAKYSNRASRRNTQYSYLGFTQPLREMRETNNLSAICEPIWTMWDHQHLTTPYASTACYGDSFTLLYVDDGRSYLAGNIPMNLNGLLRR